MTGKYISSLHIYPVKSLKGISLGSVEVNPKGPEIDRRYMLVDEQNRFITQRKYPALALVKTAWMEGQLTLFVPGQAPLTIEGSEEGVRRPVVVWESTCQAIDQGDAAGALFSHYLGVKARLVYLPEDSTRQIDPKYALTPTDQVGFADGYPFLLISEASLNDLKQRIGSDILMDRFRPNIVIAGCQPYEEDRWSGIRIGTVTFRLVKPCGRCVVTTVDQETAETGPEPLQTLATYRKKEKGIMFGQNMIHQNLGRLAVGDRLEILSEKPVESHA